nr:hypothetical protein [Pseudomonas sp. GL-B-19]
MAWLEDTEQASVIEGCLRYGHSLGPEGAKVALKARHEIVISENVARDFLNQSIAELKRDPGGEIIDPEQNSIISCKPMITSMLSLFKSPRE